MSAIEELSAYIARRFPAGTPTNTSRAVTGEPYIVVGLQTERSAGIPGTVDEGARPQFSSDEQSACALARECFDLYAKGRSGTLYWRHAPEIAWDRSGQRCAVYMRLLISDKSAMIGSARADEKMETVT